MSQASALTKPARPDPLRALVESHSIQTFILLVIIVNAIVLGMQTSPRINGWFDGGMGSTLDIIDSVCLWIFVVEIVVKLLVYRHRFFRDGWNIFDFVIVGISLAPAMGNISILRALRIMRAMRILSMVPQMRQVVQALVRALPGMASVIVVLLLLFYVAAVMATRMFGGMFPDWFGSVGKSLYSLFQIMTLESWSMGIVRPVMREFPWAWAFFVPFIIATSFTVLNLFIALIVTSMQSIYQATVQEEAEELEDTIDKRHREIVRTVEALAREVNGLRDEMTQWRRAETAHQDRD